jgi:HSP20 family protein
MANLVRRQNTFNELFDLRSSFDHLFNKVANHSAGTEDQGAKLIFAVPPIEAWVDNDKKEYHLSIAVPGIDPKEVELKIHGNNLTVVGEHKSSDEKKHKDYLEQEFSYNRFARSIVLPPGVQADKISAEYKDGVLEVSAPLSESALPKKIEIKSSGQSSGQAKSAGA